MYRTLSSSDTALNSLHKFPYYIHTHTHTHTHTLTHTHSALKASVVMIYEETEIK